MMKSLQLIELSLDKPASTQLNSLVYTGNPSRLNLEYAA